MSVGIPRPLSDTETDSSSWMVTIISSQWPAKASSIELSVTSKTMWCRPVPSSVSPMYIPGRFRTASRPFKTLILLESYTSFADIFRPEKGAAGLYHWLETALFHVKPPTAIDAPQSALMHRGHDQLTGDLGDRQKKLPNVIHIH